MRLLRISSQMLLLWILGFYLTGFLQPAKNASALVSGSGPGVRSAQEGRFLDTQDLPRDEPQQEYKDLDLERQLKKLLRELENLEKEAREKLQKDILPLIRKEIERLRKWLRDLPLKREEKEQEPLRTRAPGFPVFSFQEGGKGA